MVWPDVNVSLDFVSMARNVSSFLEFVHVMHYKSVVRVYVKPISTSKMADAPAIFLALVKITTSLLGIPVYADLATMKTMARALNKSVRPMLVSEPVDSVNVNLDTYLMDVNVLKYPMFHHALVVSTAVEMVNA
jgi:hypothetical protein